MITSGTNCLLPIASYTTSSTFNLLLDQINTTTFQVFIVIPSSPGSGSITVSINGGIPDTGYFSTVPTTTPGVVTPEATSLTYSILTSAALTSAGTTHLVVGPSVTNVSNVAAQAYLTNQVQVVVTANNASALNYGVFVY